MKTNVAAVQADEAYLAQAQAAGIYPYGYYPHNIHFVLVSAQMAGDAEHMVWAAERLNGKIPDEVAAEVGWIQAILPAPYFAHAQFSPPDVVLGLADPGDKFPFVKAMWHYARGVAHAAKGDLDAARAEAARISEINQTADFEMLLAWCVPAPDILRIARHVLEGRIAQAEGNLDQAIEEFEVAVQIQDSLPYMEPEYWYYPVRQSLGATLLMAGRAEEAVATFPGGSDRGPEQRLGALWPDAGLRGPGRSGSRQPRPRSCSTKPGRVARRLTSRDSRVSASAGTRDAPRTARGVSLARGAGQWSERSTSPPWSDPRPVLGPDLSHAGSLAARRSSG